MIYCRVVQNTAAKCGGELSFALLFSSFTAHLQISTSASLSRFQTQLNALDISDERDDEDDDYTGLEKRSRGINQLGPMAKLKDQEDEAKITLLTPKVIG